MQSGIATYVIHVRSEIERYLVAKERKKAINVKSQGKWQVVQSLTIASSSPLFRAYDLLKCIQFVLFTFELVQLQGHHGIVL